MKLYNDKDGHLRYHENWPEEHYKPMDSYVQYTRKLEKALSESLPVANEQEIIPELTLPGAVKYLLIPETFYELPEGTTVEQGPSYEIIIHLPKKDSPDIDDPVDGIENQILAAIRPETIVLVSGQSDRAGLGEELSKDVKLGFVMTGQSNDIGKSDPKPIKEFNLPPACVYNLQMIALADDDMVNHPKAGERYRFIARHILELFEKSDPENNAHDDKTRISIEAEKYATVPAFSGGFKVNREKQMGYIAGAMSELEHLESIRKENLELKATTND